MAEEFFLFIRQVILGWKHFVIDLDYFFTDDTQFIFWEFWIGIKRFIICYPHGKIFKPVYRLAKLIGDSQQYKPYCNERERYNNYKIFFYCKEIDGFFIINESLQIFPNPSGGSTTIEYKLPVNTNFGYIEIYDLNGKLFKTFRKCERGYWKRIK